MQRIKAFFYIFFKSLTSVRYYNDLLKTDLSFSIKYFFIIAPIAAVIFTFVTVMPWLPRVTQTVDAFLEQSRALYPQDLIITSREGTLEINQPQPYIVETPQALINAEGEEDFPANLIVFDADGTLDDLERYNTWVLVNSTNALFQSTNKIEVYPLNDLPEGEFSQEDYNELISGFEDIAKALPYIIGVLAFIGILFYFLVFRLAFLAALGLVLLVIGRVRGLNLEYPHYFKIAIHTFTFPLLIELLITAFGVTLDIPFWFFIVNTLLGILVIVNLEKQKA